MSAASITANQYAKYLLDSLKSGVLFRGTVRSHTTDGSTDIAWIGIEFPAVGERVVLIKDGRDLQPGQEVVIQCVPSPSNPDHYMFQMAGSPDLAAGA